MKADRPLEERRREEAQQAAETREALRRQHPQVMEQRMIEEVIAELPRLHRAGLVRFDEE